MCPNGVLTSSASGPRGVDSLANAIPSEEESDGMRREAAAMQEDGLHWKVKGKLGVGPLAPWQADLTAVVLQEAQRVMSQRHRATEAREVKDGHPQDHKMSLSQRKAKMRTFLDGVTLGERGRYSLPSKNVRVRATDTLL